MGRLVGLSSRRLCCQAGPAACPGAVRGARSGGGQAVPKLGTVMVPSAAIGKPGFQAISQRCPSGSVK
ncbi:hypothetical protein Van01_00480 [Micromonospora andamanensis]|uniref:Uncharacterized protein n=1 Tax=Micromonospora andamanensis TaxID=1287068 RepID=A0ABQ4HMH0_9ACTN|nr:hypothetical protein Van01_00480 [Micromonospora andamanensis]